MKYTTEVEINQPVQKVVELFDNPDNMKEWMEGLQSFETISGTQGHEGSKAKLIYKMANAKLR